MPAPARAQEKGLDCRNRRCQRLETRIPQGFASDMAAPGGPPELRPDPAFVPRSLFRSLPSKGLPRAGFMLIRAWHL